MPTKTDIANQSLIRIGKTLISSFVDRTREAELCNAIYDEVVDSVISLGPWTSCVFRSDLAQLITTPTWGYTHEYSLPTNPFCLKVLAVNETTPGDVIYSIEGRKLLTDESSVSIRYIGRITDPNSYDVYLRQAIISKLAYELAYALSGNEALTQRLIKQYEIDVKNGLSADGGGTAELLSSNELVDLR